MRTSERIIRNDCESRHSRESGNPGFQPFFMGRVTTWIPAFAGMTFRWLVTLVFIFGILAPVFALDSKQKIYLDSEAQLAGTRTAEFTVTTRDATTPPYNTETQVEWDSVNPDVEGGWRLSRTMLELVWEVTDFAGGIVIYTDNTNAAADPRFVDASTQTVFDRHNLDSNPAGLVLVPTSEVTSSLVIPMGWAIKPSTVALRTELEASDPKTGSEEKGPDNRFQWFFMLDKNTPAIDSDGTDSNQNSIPWDDPADGKEFSYMDPYVMTVKHAGFHGSQGPTEFFLDEDRRSYIYFMANFDGVAAQATYRTSRLILEAFIE